MDFGTIKSRLKNMFYNELDPVLKDIALVFHNCDAYNHVRMGVCVGGGGGGRLCVLVCGWGGGGGLVS